MGALTRREFLRRTAAATLAVAATPVWSGPAPSILWLRRNDDTLRLDFSTDLGYQAACWLLRDVRAGGRLAAASPQLLRLTAWMQAYLGASGIHRPFVVHSGFRTRYTNDVVGGARASMHLRDAGGRFHAMDLHADGIPAEYLGRLARSLRAGGVGLYHSQRFVHLDDGRVRHWEK